MEVRAKTKEREQARQMCLEGKSYNEIRAELGVSKSIISNWCNDIVKARPGNKKVKPPKQKQVVEHTLSETIKIARESKPLKRVDGDFPFEDYYLYILTNKYDDITRVHLVHKKDRSRKVMTLSRYRMSVKEGRVLGPHERVVCINGPSIEIDNLAIRTKEDTEEIRKRELSKPCLVCKNVFVPKKKSQTLCSNKCRHIAHRSAVKPVTPPKFTLTCVICEDDFKSKNPDAELCSKKSCRDIVKRYSD